MLAVIAEVIASHEREQPRQIVAVGSERRQVGLWQAAVHKVGAEVKKLNRAKQRGQCPKHQQVSFRNPHQPVEAVVDEDKTDGLPERPVAAHEA